MLHRLWFGAAASINNWILALLIFLTLLSIAVEYLASTVGAKKNAWWPLAK